MRKVEGWVVYSCHKGGSEIVFARYADEKTARHWVGYYNQRDCRTRTRWHCRPIVSSDIDWRD